MLWACAVGWAVSLALWQPLAERVSGHLDIGNYWARDLRMALIVLAAATLVCAGRGRRGAGRGAIAGALAWVALDVLLDRANLAGVTAAAGLAAVAGLVLTGLCLLARRGEPKPGAAGLYVAAVFALTAAEGIGWIPGAPEDASALWRPAGGLLLLLGCAVTVGCVAVAEPGRAKPVAIAVGALLALSILVYALAPLIGGAAWLLSLLLVALHLVLLTMLVGSAWSVRRDGGWAAAAGAVLAGWLAPLVLLMLTWGEWSNYLARYNEWVIGDQLTRLAGNQPVYDPQAYTPSAYLSCVLASILGAFVVVGAAWRKRSGRVSPPGG
ncbi:hypothetical protein BKA01_002273 [Pseudonocardia eucalypti]|nr:hypothetical protein [Pseudonocardia eucalypti]